MDTLRPQSDSSNTVAPWIFVRRGAALYVIRATSRAAALAMLPKVRAAALANGGSVTLAASQEEARAILDAQALVDARQAVKRTPRRWTARPVEVRP